MQPSSPASHILFANHLCNKYLKFCTENAFCSDYFSFASYGKEHSNLIEHAALLSIYYLINSVFFLLFHGISFRINLMDINYYHYILSGSLESHFMSPLIAIHTCVNHFLFDNIL